MNAPLSRRAMLGASAAISAVGLPIAATSVLASPTDLDAELFLLLDRWGQARAAWDATEAPYSAAKARAKAAYPPMPDALWSSGRDHCFDLGVMPTGRALRPSGHIGAFFQPGDVEALRAAPPVTRWSLVTDDHPGPPPLEPDPKGEARRQEIIAAHDGWMRTRRAVEDATGYTAAVVACEAAADALNDADDALKLCRPCTLAGLMRKAAWVADLLARKAGDDDLAETFVCQVAAFGGVVS